MLSLNWDPRLFPMVEKYVLKSLELNSEQLLLDFERKMVFRVFHICLLLLLLLAMAV